jgi:DNA-binding transcriptional regulator YiaG
MSIGQDIEKYRSKSKFSQADLAKQWGISVRTLQNWEQGHREPRGAARRFVEGILREGCSRKTGGS